MKSYPRTSAAKPSWRARANRPGAPGCRGLLPALLVTALGLVAASPASAQFALDEFRTQGDARAGWVATAPPPGAIEGSSIELFVNGGSPADFDDGARALFKGFSGPLPPVPPSFDTRAATTGAGGGSTRLEIRFTDGGKAILRPVRTVAGEWVREDGTTDWDTYGGTCGYRSQQDYATVVGCHPGAAVTSVEIVNDSGWLYPGGYQTFADNVTYAGVTVSAPAPAVLGDTVKAPVLGRQVNVRPTSGVVRVRRGGKGRFVALSKIRTLPVRSIIDASKGRVQIVAARARGAKTQSGTFSGGTFQLLQSRKRSAGGVTELRLKGASFAACGGTASLAGLPSGSDGPVASLARSKRSIRRLKGSSNRGRFQTRGRFAAATVRGTKWTVDDRCDGTLTRVTKGTVVVRDLRLGRSVTVRAGKSYLAKAP